MAANGYQKHILIGNLGADPKVNQTRNGHLVTNFDIAVNERNVDGTEVVMWYGITAWNGLGEACAEYLTKGRQVMVEGTRLEVNAWMGRDGNLHTKMELTAKDVKFLGGNDQQEPVQEKAQARQQEQVPAQRQSGPTRQQEQVPAQRQSGPTRQQQTRRQSAPVRQQQGPTRRRQSAKAGQQKRQQRQQKRTGQVQYIPDNAEKIAF